jgi:branched-chain amino acid transport system permease protein
MATFTATRRLVRPVVAIAVVVFLALLPQLTISVPYVLPGPTYSVGTEQLLALCLLVGALAVTYDLLFGLTGLLSFGHALYFAIGVYVFAIALRKWQLAIVPAALVTLGIGVVAAAVIGAISLRVDGISFAMVTLAFAQAGSLFVYRNFSGYTGGDEGLGLAGDRVPSSLLGVSNTSHLYWLALILAVVVYALIAWLARTRAGRVMAAVRENELRVRVIGIRPYLARWIAFVVAGSLATIVGMGYLLLEGGASPQITTPTFTLSLLVMVVLGGVGARWGALVGGVVYTLLDQRLTVLAASHDISTLPAVLRVPLSQPLFILGTLFVLVVMFLPGGLAGAADRLRGRRRRTGPTRAAPAPTEPILEEV